VNQLRDNLKALGLSPNHIFQQVKDAIGEDLAGGQDLTSVATITDTQVVTADFTARANGVISGLHVAAAVLEYCGVNHYEVLVDEGAKVSAGKVLITAQGNTQKILLAERTALSISAAFNAIKKMFPGKSIEIEVDSIDQLKEAITLKPELILLDNMSPELCSEAVSVTAGALKLEASGGITFNNAKAYANSGVNYLAIGSLTHSAPALDIGLDFRKGK